MLRVEEATLYRTDRTITRKFEVMHKWDYVNLLTGEAEDRFIDKPGHNRHWWEMYTCNYARAIRIRKIQQKGR